MAKAQPQPRPAKPAAIPTNWGQMSAAEKGAWRAQNQPNNATARPVGPAKQFPPSMGTTPAQEQTQEQTQEQRPQEEQNAELGTTTFAGGTKITIELPGCEPVETDLIGFVPTLLQQLAIYFSYNAHTG